ncbi:MAG TPA: 4-alpha-glucanotransferase [Bryobacteraceae bacterium]
MPAKIAQSDRFKTSTLPFTNHVVQMNQFAAGKHISLDRKSVWSIGTPPRTNDAAARATPKIEVRMHEIHFEAAVNYDDALWRAAAESAIDSHYYDIFGQRHDASRDTLRAILSALGWNTESFESVEDERRRRFAADLDAGLARTSVVSENDKWIPFSVAREWAGEIEYEVQLENGDNLGGSLNGSQLVPIAGVVLFDRRWLKYRLNLPNELPLGYHVLKLALDGRSLGEFYVIVCPDRTYLPAELEQGRTAGFNVALYGLRSDRNWGCGDFSDLKALIEWAAGEIGFHFIGLNPLHALHNRAPYNTSPYLPLSVYYKNLLYIDIESVPEFASSGCARNFRKSAALEREIQYLRASQFVQYARVDRLKRRFLKLLYREFRRGGNMDRKRLFSAYCEREGSQLERFALYCALDEALHKQNRNWWTWRDWPQPYQNPDSAESQAFALTHGRSIEFYKYVQFVLEEQLAAAQQHARNCGMTIGLYHDLAVATDNCGSDLWAYREYYASGCRVGAPPDDFSPQGQDWGFPPPNKEAHRNDGYRLFRESIRKIVRDGGALRLDHVMRLYRLFWVPAGMQPAAGAYVRDYAEDLLHILALESVRSRNIIIGEDLGTLTDEMRELFTRFGILSYRLFPFEKNYQTGEFKHSWEYPRQALVSSSTHDLPTLAGFWQSRDIHARRAAGFADEAGFYRQLEERHNEKQRMLDMLHSENLLPASYTRDAGAIQEMDGDLHNAIVAFLANVPSMLLLLNQEDYTKESEQQNLPGTTAQYPNWQRKMAVPVDQLRSEAAAPYNKMFHDQLQRSRRGCER